MSGRLERRVIVSNVPREKHIGGLCRDTQDERRGDIGYSVNEQDYIPTICSAKPQERSWQTLNLVQKAGRLNTIIAHRSGPKISLILRSYSLCNKVFTSQSTIKAPMNYTSKLLTPANDAVSDRLVELLMIADEMPTQISKYLDLEELINAEFLSREYEKIITEIIEFSAKSSYDFQAKLSFFKHEILSENWIESSLEKWLTCIANDYRVAERRSKPGEL